MVKKIVGMLIILLFILPSGNLISFEAKNSAVENKMEIDDFKIEKKEYVNHEISVNKKIKLNVLKPNQIGFAIHTKYNGIEKDSTILDAIFSGIDIDNNPSTGVNGKDVRVSIILLPLIQQIDIGWILTFSIALKVIRMGEELKYGDFEIYFKGNIFYSVSHTFKIGYYSPQNEEIPREIREVVTIVPYIFYEKNPEFYINLEPVFDDGNQNLSVIMEYSNTQNHKVMIDYFPAANSMIKISPDISLKKLNISIERFADVEQTIKIRYEDNFGINITVEDIPVRMAFTLGFSENYFEYIASDEFNATLVIEYRGVEFCIKLEYLPRHLISNFGEGYIYVYINERKTKFTVCNDIDSPTNYLSISNLTGEATIQWKGEQEGYIIVDGFKGLELEIYSETSLTHFLLYSILKAEHFEIRWNISLQGYIFIDTNWEWLSFYSLNITIDDVFGVLIESNLLRADDFNVAWQTIPPIFQIDGEIDFIGDITFSIMLNGIWYDVF
ncbi:MAG TPA: hypothetical protein ENI33_09385 [Thermoplasmatales archaeon]|nr:hypothetical protein [Thermoplasmatales archaeon]